MTLGEKRQVIEVLMCIGDPWKCDVVPENACSIVGCSALVAGLADLAWEDVDAYDYDCTQEGACADYTEAAYRLIESSPTLRREWFGAR